MIGKETGIIIHLHRGDIANQIPSTQGSPTNITAEAAVLRTLLHLVHETVEAVVNTHHAAVNLELPVLKVIQEAPPPPLRPSQVTQPKKALI